MSARPKSVPPRRPAKTPRKAPAHAAKAKTLLFRLRNTDSPYGVSASTLKALSTVMGVPETQVIHQALRKLADDFIPAYEADDGPVSDDTLHALKTREHQDRY